MKLNCVGDTGNKRELGGPQIFYIFIRQVALWCNFVSNGSHVWL